MEGKRTRDLPGELAEEEVFRPWRSETAYAVLLVVLASLLVVFWYVEANQVLDSQIALGIDPERAVKFVSIAIAAGTLILTFSALRARRSLLATGELRLSGSTLIVSTGPSSVVREISELRQIGCYPSGACVRMLFRDGAVRLPGWWLPSGWRPTWRGWRTPNNSMVRLSRKTHPLLGALRARRPDLKPGGLGFAGIVRTVGAELLTGVLGVFVATIGSYPLVAEARRAAGRQHVDDVAMKAFQGGRYLEACEDFRRALPDLRHEPLRQRTCGGLSSVLRRPEERPQGGRRLRLTTVMAGHDGSRSSGPDTDLERKLFSGRGSPSGTSKLLAVRDTR